MPRFIKIGLHSFWCLKCLNFILCLDQKPKAHFIKFHHHHPQMNKWNDWFQFQENGNLGVNSRQ
ncbi:hypothetical protein BLOT_000226 [Blomia tropicalis]|nr:hypothetical protein BLOT_000226 [Blomia tropicalis]